MWLWTITSVSFNTGNWIDFTGNGEGLLALALKKMRNMSIYEQNPLTGADTDAYYTMLQSGSSIFDGDQKKYPNPVAVANLAKNQQRTYDMTPELIIQYQLLGMDEDHWQLNWRGSVYMNIYNEYNNRYYPQELRTVSWNDGSGVNTTYDGSSKSVSFNTNQTLTLIPAFKNKDHSLLALARVKLTSGSSTGQSEDKSGASSGIEGTQGGGQIRGLSSWYNQWRSLYFTYSVHYAYKSRYMADFSIRRDGSTKFGPDNRWGTFPAFSLRWNISKEPWVQEKLPWLSMLSVRPGVGIVGTQPNGDYLFYSKYRNGDGYMGGRSTYPSNVQLKQLKWEEKKTWNLGFDFGFLNDKITGNIELYRQYTKDLLMQNRSIATSSGYAKLDYDNVGKMENVGWEFNINSNNLIKFGKLGIDLNVTFANNRNIITEMDETCLRSLNDDFNHGNGQYMTRIEIDKPFGAVMVLLPSMNSRVVMPCMKI